MAGRDSPQSGPEDANAPGGSLPGGKPAGRSRKRTPTAWFGTLSQLDFDIDFFERLLARKADSVEVLRILAELVSKRGLVNRAVALDRRLVELLPDDFLARYNLACSLARAGQSDEAAHMESDPDLESLKSHPDFQALLGSE